MTAALSSRIAGPEILKGALANEDRVGNVLFLCGPAAFGHNLVVVAQIQALSLERYKQFPKDPDCDKETSSGEYVLCLGGRFCSPKGIRRVAPDYSKGRPEVPLMDSISTSSTSIFVVRPRCANATGGLLMISSTRRLCCRPPATSAL